jgi:hypothetical protein
VSDAILDETARVLNDKFHVPDEDVHDLRQELLGFAKHVTPAEALDAVPGDKADNRILECAVAAGSGKVAAGDAKDGGRSFSAHGHVVAAQGDGAVREKFECEAPTRSLSFDATRPGMRCSTMLSIVQVNTESRHPLTGHFETPRAERRI